uniref:Homeobox domain-containing protein n=1 Tax=Acrobeloides nanus TaxID=290746 RepID=A0A914DAJ2_9BILA
MQDLMNMCSQPPTIQPIILKQNPYFFALKDLLIDRKKEICFPYAHNAQYDLDNKNSELEANLVDCFALTETNNDEDNQTDTIDDLSEHVEEIREDFERSMCEIDQGITFRSMQLHDTLKHQQEFRPITEQDIQTSLDALKQRQLFWETELKAITCNRIMLLRTTLNTKRKRKNFSKKATLILNEYFDSHMDQPYPDDETKAKLAKRCGISPVQVSNWFGNKRIRFRKALVKREKGDQNHDHAFDFSNSDLNSTSSEFASNDELCFPFLHTSSTNNIYSNYL